MLSDAEYLRYGRQLMLSESGEAGQALLIEPLIDGDKLHMGVVGRQPLAGQLGLGAAQPLFIEQDLSLIHI